MTQDPGVFEQAQEGCHENPCSREERGEEVPGIQAMGYPEGEAVRG